MSAQRVSIGKKFAAFITSIFSVSLAAGQNAEQPEGQQLEEIVVTAQKREERLQDVPISISVLRGDQLDTSTSDGLSDLLNRVPGVVAGVATQQGSGTQLTVRGVTAGATTISGSSPVAYYLDTLPFGFVKSAITPDMNP